MKHYSVYTPQYTEYKYYPDEPPEITADCVYVEANTKREAKVKAVREMRRQGMSWIDYRDIDRASPFTGLKADEMECKHGNCWCEICSAKKDWVECSQCLEQWEQEDQEDNN